MLTSYRDKKIVHLLLTRLPCGFRQEKKKLADELGSQARNLYFKFIYYFKPILVDVLHEGPPHNPSANQPSIAGSCAPHGEIVYRYLQSRSSTRKAFVPWLQVAAAAPALLLASAPLRPCSAPAPLPAPPRCCPRAERPPLRPPRLLGPDSARPVGDFAAPRDSRGSSAAASASPVSLCAFSRRHSALWPSSASFQCSSWCSCRLHKGTMVTIRFPTGKHGVAQAGKRWLQRVMHAPGSSTSRSCSHCSASASPPAHGCGRKTAARTPPGSTPAAALPRPAFHALPASSPGNEQN